MTINFNLIIKLKVKKEFTRQIKHLIIEIQCIIKIKTNLKQQVKLTKILIIIYINKVLNKNKYKDLILIFYSIFFKL